MTSVEELTGDEGLTREEVAAKRRRRMMRRRRTTTIVVASLLVLGVGGVGAVSVATGAVSDLFGADDYEGEGTEETLTIEVAPGSSTTQIANQLVEADVIKSAKPFISAVEDEGGSIQARAYTMRKQMSGAAAAQAMLSPEDYPRLVVPEGLKLVDIQARMIEAGLAEDEVTKAIEDRKPSDYGIEAEAPSLEGYLYPATYEIRPEQTAEDVVQMMADKTAEEISALGIPAEDVNMTLTLASLVEIESPGDEEVRKKVARVFLNRIGSDSQTGGLLQSDATVAYIHGARKDLTTTEEERQSDSPYNTYKHKGLPPGPVNSPSRGSVEAAMNPADGDWQYFVAVNPDTGETKFASNYDDHMKNVEEFRAWLREHRANETDSAGG